MSNWIDVNDRLPEPCSDVLVTTERAGYKDVRFCYFDGDKNFYDVHDFSLSKIVTAWMPLPEPYEPPQTTEP